LVRLFFSGVIVHDLGCGFEEVCEGLARRFAGACQWPLTVMFRSIKPKRKATDFNQVKSYCKILLIIDKSLTHQRPMPLPLNFAVKLIILIIQNPLLIFRE